MKKKIYNSISGFQELFKQRSFNEDTAVIFFDPMTQLVYGADNLSKIDMYNDAVILASREIKEVVLPEVGDIISFEHLPTGNKFKVIYFNDDKYVLEGLGDVIVVSDSHMIRFKHSVVGRD